MRPGRCGGRQSIVSGIQRRHRQRRKRRVFGVVHRVAEIARRQREEQRGEPSGRAAESAPGEKAAEHDAGPSEDRNHHVADDIGVAGKHVLRGDAENLDQSAIEILIAQSVSKVARASRPCE